MIGERQNRKHIILEKYQDKIGVVKMYKRLIKQMNDSDYVDKKKRVTYLEGKMGETMRHLEMLETKYPHYLI